MRRAVAAAFALVGALILLAQPGLAQTAGAGADISGGWAFKTDPYENFRCQMTGELNLIPTAEPDVFNGELIAYEACNGQQIYEAHQTVVAVRNAGRLVLTSTLQTVLPETVSYAPDNFELYIVNGALMVGELRSADVAPVTFQRREALVS